MIGWLERSACGGTDLSLYGTLAPRTIYTGIHMCFISALSILNPAFSSALRT